MKIPSVSSVDEYMCVSVLVSDCVISAGTCQGDSNIMPGKKECVHHKME